MSREFVIDPTSDAMRQAAESFFDLLYVKKDFAGAMRGHVSERRFTEHNPELPNSPADQIAWFEERHEANPEFFAAEAEWQDRQVHRFIAANYLIVHYWMSVGPTDKGRMFADFWRFEDDKIVEHWDVVQPVPEETKSGNPMW
ncbi:MAG: hypothetical protein P0Y56_16165 [Candidatus Andeanibacterium colombiense]|uniref:SnoaL-like domain-containing protein n=1 Tax=Candidatus Andeanibacterium colombiense TaxID=3121345 RepID=A0AAJ5X8H7_9SPHN|nr:MAG: hypothetical protein P0Y56_16165 [Sphingomonadaceae bacterium]